MKRPFIFAFLFLSAVTLSWTLSPSGLVSVGASPASEAKAKGMELQLSYGTPWIHVDNNEKPFKLKYVDHRFDAESLVEFLNVLVTKAAKEKQGQPPIVVVENGTKRIVDGEKLFNDALRKLVDEHAVTVIHLPRAVGYSSELIEFQKSFEEFKQQKEASLGKQKPAKEVTGSLECSFEDQFMPLSLESAVRQVREKHYAFPPAAESALNAARARDVPEELLAFYSLCDGALIGTGDDFPGPDGRRFRLRIPRLAELETTQACGYISADSPLFQHSAKWWQVVDYGDGNYLAFDASADSGGRIIDIFHGTAGEPDYHAIIASSLSNLLEGLLRHGEVYWLDEDFPKLGYI